MRMNKARRGFSLIELLVVIAIIAVLMALTSAAVIKFRATAMSRTTTTNLSKSRAKLGEQWKTYTDRLNNHSLSDPNNAAYANAARATFPGALDSDTRVKARYVQLRQVQAFPMNFTEAFWPITGTPAASAPDAWTGYGSPTGYLAGLGITPSNYSSWSSLPADVQASICVLMILERGPGGNGATADDLGTTAVGNVSLGGSATARGIIDAWQKPVLFIRTNTPGQAISLTLRSPATPAHAAIDVTYP